MHMVEYRRNQKQLMETQASLRGDRLDVERCQSRQQALERQQQVLDTQRSNPSCRQPGFPPWRPDRRHRLIEAALTAEQIGYPVAGNTV